MSTESGPRTRVSVPVAARARTSRPKPPAGTVSRASSGGAEAASARITARPAPATRSQWVPEPLTPPSMHLRSRTGCGPNNPGTAALAAAALAAETPAAAVTTKRSPE